MKSTSKSTGPAVKPARRPAGIAVNAALRGKGRGPKPGAINAGRPRDEWKAWLRALVDSDTTRQSIAAILTDPTHTAFPRVLAWADERGYGKEIMPIDATVSQLVVIRRDESAQGRGATV
jgi:hypothetical protein